MAEDGDIAAEWVFSLLSNSFQDSQQASLEDYISTSVMLQYNSCFHRHGHNHYYIMSSIIRIIGRIKLENNRHNGKNNSRKLKNWGIE